MIDQAKASLCKCNKVGATRQWLAKTLGGKGEEFIDPDCELVRHSENRGPGNQCPADPLTQSGKGWRSCQGLDSSSTSIGQLGQQHKGG